MHDELIQPRLTSDSHSHWKPRVVVRTSELAIIGEVDVDASEGPVPPLESLEQRYAASAKEWLGGWLADDADPCQPR